MKVSTFERRIEREFLRLGKQLAQPAYRRIEQLTDSLTPDFPITGLRMGMGIYCLLGGDVDVVYSDDSVGPFQCRSCLNTTRRIRSGRLPG